MDSRQLGQYNLLLELSSVCTFLSEPIRAWEKTNRAQLRPDRPLAVSLKKETDSQGDQHFLSGPFRTQRVGVGIYTLLSRVMLKTHLKLNKLPHVMRAHRHYQCLSQHEYEYIRRQLYFEMKQDHYVSHWTSLASPLGNQCPLRGAAEEPHPHSWSPV